MVGVGEFLVVISRGPWAVVSRLSFVEFRARLRGLTLFLSAGTVGLYMITMG